MPIIKNAKKAMRVAERRTAENEVVRRTYRHALKTARKSLATADLSAAQKQVMKAAKNGVVHKNKARRLISRLAKSASMAASAPA